MTSYASMQLLLAMMHECIRGFVMVDRHSTIVGQTVLTAHAPLFVPLPWEFEIDKSLCLCSVQCLKRP